MLEADAMSNARVSEIVTASHAFASRVLAERNTLPASISGKAKSPRNNKSTKRMTNNTQATIPAGRKTGKKAEMRSIEAIMDEMQKSAEAAGDTKNSVKKLDAAITLFAKSPISKLRSVIASISDEYLPPKGSDLDYHIKAGLETYWQSAGNWETMMTKLEEDLGPTAENTSQWMRMAVAAGNELSEARIKDLIKERGGVKALPRARRGSNPDQKSKLRKTDYLTTLVDMLRAENDNDYEKVHAWLVNEGKSAGKKRGFGS